MRNFWYSFLIIVLFCSLSVQVVTSPWYLKNEWTSPFTYSGTVIVDSVSNGTHIFILNSWFVLYVVAYGSSGFTPVGTYDLSASAGLEVCCGNYDHTRSTKVATFNVNPYNKAVYLVKEIVGTNKQNQHWYRYDLPSTTQTGYASRGWNTLYINPLLRLWFDTTTVYTSRCNQPTSQYPKYGIHHVRHTTSLSLLSQPFDPAVNASAVDYIGCQSNMICVWEGTTSLRLYSTSDLSLQQTIILGDPFAGLNFDLSGAKNSTGSGLYFLYRDQNGRFYIQGRNNLFSLTLAGNFPFTVTFPAAVPSYDLKVSSSGSVWAGVTTPLNSTFGRGDIEIVLAKYNAQLQLQNYIILSTFKQDNLSRIFPQDGDNLVIVGATDGKLQFPTEAATKRSAFAAQLQYFNITNITSAVPNSVMTGELVYIKFSSLPPSASSGIPTVLVGNVASAQVSWNGTDLAVRIPSAPGGFNELVVIFGYLPINSSVSRTIRTLSLPVVSSVTPTQGPAVGFPITIDTLNLGYPGQEPAVVTVGGVLCLNIVQYDAKKLNCTAPPGTGRDNTVVVSLGPGLNSAEQLFISYDPPFLHSVTPATGPTVGGNVIRIRGSNFGPCSSIFSCPGTEQNITVAINGNVCGSVTHHNDTDISCSAPGGIGVNYSLVVTINGQASTNSLVYSYAIPIINRLVPATSTSTNPTVFLEGLNYGPFANTPVIVFQDVNSQQLYPCSLSSWVSDSSAKCEFLTPIPNFATFNVSITVLNQTSDPSMTVQFRTGITNNPPSANAFNSTTNEDTPLIIQLSGTDTDVGDSVQMYIASAPQNGTLYQFLTSALNFKGQLIDPTLSPTFVSDASSRVLYIPAQDFNGSDSFIFRARDLNNAESANQTATLLITAVPDAPVARSSLVVINEDTPSIINFTAVDPDTNTNIVSVILTTIPSPDKGSIFELDDSFTQTTAITTVPHRISGNRKQILYVPPQDKFGDVYTAIRFVADDGASISAAEGIVSVTILSVNDAPVSSNSTVVSAEDTDIPFQFGCSDADSADQSKLMVTIKSIPPVSAGTLRRADQTRLELRIDDRVNGTALFSPKLNYYGNFTVEFQCSDGTLQSSNSFVHIYVQNVNDPPASADMLIIGNEDEHLTITLNPVDIDTDAEFLSVIILTLPAQGTLFAPLDRTDQANLTLIELTSDMLPTSLPFSRRTLLFRPSLNAFGTPYASFTYQVDDGSDISTPSTITLNIVSVNDPPFFNKINLNLVVLEDTPATFTFDIQDIDPGDRPIVKVTDIRIQGSLFQVRTSTGTSSSSALGEGSDIAGPPFQIQYVPSRNFFSPSGADQAFNITYSDTTGNVSFTEEIKFAVVGVNDQPKINCDEPNIELPAGFLTGSIARFRFSVEVDDVDDQDFDLHFVTTPAKGALYDSDGKVISVGEALKTQNFTFRSSDSGGSYPYSNFTMFAVDPHGGVSNQCTFTFLVNCPAGLYNNIFSADRGPICANCPVGAVCYPDGRQPPTPQPGYWQSENKTYIPCSLIDACPGYANNSCGVGYTGTRCALCEKFHYKLNNKCVPCAENSLVPLLTVMALFLGCALGISILAALERKGPGFLLFGVFINFIQTILILRDFRLNWPPEFHNVLNYLSFINFNVELTSPECFVPQENFNYSLKMKYTLAIPILLLISTTLIFLIYSLMRPLSRIIFDLEDTDALRVDSTRYKIFRILHMLLTVVYTSVTSASLALFDCSRELDGQYYLDIDPSIRCYTDQWYQDVPYSVAAICVYVIGIPLYFFLIYYFHYQTTRTSPFWTSLRKLCGKIVSVERHYKKEYQFFAVIQLFQKLCVVAAGMFFTRYKGLQTILTLMILLSSLFTYVKFKPYAYELLNKMEMLSIMSSTVILGFGLAFLDDINFTMRYALTVFIIAVIFGVSTVIFGVSVYEIKTSVRERMNSKKEAIDRPVLGRSNISMTIDRYVRQTSKGLSFQ